MNRTHTLRWDISTSGVFIFQHCSDYTGIQILWDASLYLNIQTFQNSVVRFLSSFIFACALHPDRIFNAHLNKYVCHSNYILKEKWKEQPRRVYKDVPLHLSVSANVLLKWQSACVYALGEDKNARSKTVNCSPQRDPTKCSYSLGEK